MSIAVLRIELMEAYTELLALIFAVALMLRWEYLRRKRYRRERIVKGLRLILGGSPDCAPRHGVGTVAS
jgi:hypothetical protein